MEKFTPKTFTASDINGGNKFEDGDFVSPSAINAPIEAALLLQALATNAPVVETDSTKTPKVLIRNNTFVFKNLGSGEANIEVDSYLSAFSDNPVQNKIITKHINDINAK